MLDILCWTAREALRQDKQRSGSVGAAHKVYPNWSQETITCHSSNCFSFVWSQGNAPLVTSLPIPASSCSMTHFNWCERFVFLVPVRSLLSSDVIAVYHVNDKLHLEPIVADRHAWAGRGRGKERITSEITLFTQSTFFFSTYFLS